MKTRIISGICMVPLLLFVFLGGYWLVALCVFIAAMGINEFFNGFQAMDVKPSKLIAYLSIAGIYFIHFFVSPGYKSDCIMLWLAICVMTCSIYIFKIDQRKIEDAMATILGIVYIVFFSYHVVLVDRTGEYSILIWLVLISAFCTDIFAYFSGYFFGKHKLAPVLSPKKTIEGAIGGTLGSVLCCTVFGCIAVPEIWMHCLIIGIIASILSQCGDLTASAYKRKMGIKDYGNLIPGHGGVMDRVDSVLFTAPVVYYYIHFILM